MKLLTAILALLATSPVFADDDLYWYVDIPEYMTYEQTSVECTYTDEKRMGSDIEYIYVTCNPVDQDKRFSDTYSTVATDGNDVFVKHQEVGVEIDCDNGICSSVSNGEYLGRIAQPVVTSFYIQRGYYVYRNSEGVVVQHKKGTGPLADRTFIPYVEELEKQRNEAMAVEDEPQVDTTNGVARDLDIYCNPRNFNCFLNGEPVDIGSLPNYFKMADVEEEFTDTHSCYDAICVDKEDYFIGLNPVFYENRGK